MSRGGCVFGGLDWKLGVVRIVGGWYFLGAYDDEEGEIRVRCGERRFGTRGVLG